VIDMQMPGMDGEALGRIIRADPRQAGTQMVMLTSMGAHGDASRLKAAGFSGYATKPVRQQELKRVLSLALSTRDGTEPPSQPEGLVAPSNPGRDLSSLFAGRAARILVADDNSTNQQVALGILKKLGLHADAVANGAEAIHALATLPYDLVLMDAQMPEMDGYEATREIRNAVGAMRDIPIIAVTAHAMPADRDRCLQAGMNDYLAKPISPLALAEALDRWLPVAGAAAPARPPAARLPEPTDVAAAAERVTARAFDREGLLARVMDDEALARSLARGFLEDIPRQLAALKAHLASGDASGVQHQLHTLKGASASMGADALSAVASEMEVGAMAGDLAMVDAGVPRLTAHCDRTTAAIEEQLFGRMSEYDEPITH
jgi:CheY-like chemotaxis protein/HPt (histidine-containing phosphotransfer) domain-containing protein